MTRNIVVLIVLPNKSVRSTLNAIQFIQTKIYCNSGYVSSEGTLKVELFKRFVKADKRFLPYLICQVMFFHHVEANASHTILIPVYQLAKQIRFT
jgi:hypothetical protein